MENPSADVTLAIPQANCMMADDVSRPASQKIVLLSDPGFAPDEDTILQFRLTYDGLLLATQRDPVTGQRDPRAPNKHELRQAFHYQLRRLWDVTPFLKNGRTSGPQLLATEASPDSASYDIDTLTKRYALYGWHFVPLVTQDLNLLCGLDILFLRPDSPGQVLRSGDIDNRLKTLFDSLRIPAAGENYSSKKYGQEEDPLFVLLEDDRLITKVAVETDQLLQFEKQGNDMNAVRLVITVHIRPYEMHQDNLQFG